VAATVNYSPKPTSIYNDQISIEAMDRSKDDLISSLPDCVIGGEIITRLPVADAARLQILSTRWRNIWRSSPLNLDLPVPIYYHDYKDIVSTILAAHPGPARRLKVDWPYDDGESYSRWLQSRAVTGLQELEIEPRYYSWWEGTVFQPPPPDKTRTLPEWPLFQFAPTLRLLKIGHHTCFPSVGAMAALRFPRLEVISFCGVDISEGTLHGILAGCPVLRTLVLDDCTGFATVRINSPTITSFAISPSHSSRGFDYDHEEPRVWVTTSQVIIEDAPILEKLVLFRRLLDDTAEPFQFQLLVLSAPRVKVLGSLSSAIRKLEIGGTVLQRTVIMEKPLQMRTVKVLALEDADSIDVVSNYLKCFPCLEKLYIRVRELLSQLQFSFHLCVAKMPFLSLPIYVVSMLISLGYICHL
jgi:hypothetical protein